MQPEPIAGRLGWLLIPLARHVLSATLPADIGLRYSLQAIGEDAIREDAALIFERSDINAAVRRTRKTVTALVVVNRLTGIDGQIDAAGTERRAARKQCHCLRRTAVVLQRTDSWCAAEDIVIGGGVESTDIQRGTEQVVRRTERACAANQHVSIGRRIARYNRVGQRQISCITGRSDSADHTAADMCASTITTCAVRYDRTVDQGQAACNGGQLPQSSTQIVVAHSAVAGNRGVDERAEGIAQIDAACEVVTVSGNRVTGDRGVNDGQGS